MNEFNEFVDGEIINTTLPPFDQTPVWCAKCGLECETEAIIKDGKPYHYRCSGIEL